MNEVLSRLAEIPGVQAVALSTAMPMTGGGWQDAISRSDNPLPMGQQPIASMRWVSPSYRSMLHIPLIEGRDLGAFDRDNPRNVLISQNAAHEIWHGRDPIGETFNAGGETYTVVGIVANTRLDDLKHTTPSVYIPFWDNPINNITFLIRSPLPTSTLADSIRQAIWKVDPEVSIPDLKSMTEQISDSLAAEQLQGWLLSSFAIVALILAFLGIYGTLAYSISLRTREFGIRIALGCNRGTLALLVLRRGFSPIITGIVAGLGIGLVATRWAQSLLYHVSPVDPAVIATCIGIVLCAALLATLVPAHRAASVDPMQALRTE
jgi:predicted permease